MHPVDGGFRFVPPDAAPDPRRARTPPGAVFASGSLARVVVVMASAGFGKTTLLVAGDRRQRGFDRCRRRLVQLLVRRRHRRHARRRAVPCARRGCAVVAARRVEALAENIWHQAPAQVAIVVDDVHLVAPDSQGADVLAQLVGALPRNGHIVLAGRAQPPVPLARLEVAGEVVRLGESDLSFSLRELADFASRRGVPVEQVTGCGGWPALAEVSTMGGPGTDAAYLWEEVLDRLPEDRRRDLALVAHAEVIHRGRRGGRARAATSTSPSSRPGCPLASTSGDGWLHVHALWLPHLARLVTRPRSTTPGDGRHSPSPNGETSGRRSALLARAEAWDDMARVVVDALGVSSPPMPGRRRRHVARTASACLRRRAAGQAAERRRTGPPRSRPPPPPSCSEAAEAFESVGRHGRRARRHRPARAGGLVAERRRSARGRGPPVPRDGGRRVRGGGAVGVPGPGTGRRPRQPARRPRWPSSTASPTGRSTRRGWASSTASERRRCAISGAPSEGMQHASASLKVAGPLYQPLVEATWYGARWTTGQVDEVLDGLARWSSGRRRRASPSTRRVIAATHAMLAAVADRVDDADRSLRARPHPGGRALVAAGRRQHLAGRGGAARRPWRRGGRRRRADGLPGAATPSAAGIGASAQQRALTLWYVLVPDDPAALGRRPTSVRTSPRRATWPGPSWPCGPATPAPLRPAARVEPEVVRGLPPAAVGDRAGARPGPGRRPARAGAARVAVAAGTGPRAPVGRRARQPVRAARPAPHSPACPSHPPVGSSCRLLGSVELRRDGRPVRRARVAPPPGPRPARPTSCCGDPTGASSARPTCGPSSTPRARPATCASPSRTCCGRSSPSGSGRDASFLVQTHGDTLHRAPGRVVRHRRLALRRPRRRPPSTPTGGASRRPPSGRWSRRWRCGGASRLELAVADWALPDVEARRAKVGRTGHAGRASCCWPTATPTGRGSWARSRSGSTPGPTGPTTSSCGRTPPSAHRRAAHAAVAGYGEALREVGLRDDEVRQPPRRPASRSSAR